MYSNRSPCLPLLICFGALIAAAASSAFAQCELEELPFSGEPVAGDVAIDNDRVFVGAPTFDDDPTDDIIPGGVYVFRLEGEVWVEEIVLMASADEYLGMGVAAADDRVVAGARNAAYVFRRDGAGWTEEGTFAPADGGGGFGRSLSIDGDFIAAGRPYDDAVCPSDPDCNSGSAYVFRWDGEDWIEHVKLIASDAARHDYFGGSVAVGGDVLFVGAMGDDGDPVYGSVYVYSRDDSGTPQDPADDLWVETTKLRPSVEDYVFGFGASISLDADRLLVGATYAFCDQAGDAFVYRREGNEWIDEARLTPSDFYGDDDAFGWSVSLAGDVALVGAWRYGNFDCLWNGGYGAAYVFRRLGGEWIGAPGIMEPEPEWLDRFGMSVAVSNEYAAVASPWGDSTTFVFDLAGATDCNGNAVLDYGDISSGTSEDVNGDCVPDECQPGACCNTLTGACLDNVAEGDCAGGDWVWLENTMCVAANCTPAEGACCNALTGQCQDGVIQASCDQIDQVWTRDATCDEVVCEPATGACCDTGAGECSDNIASLDCTGDDLVWHRDQLCSEADCRPPFVAIPTTSKWGLLTLSLLLLVLAKVGFGRQRAYTC